MARSSRSSRRRAVPNANANDPLESLRRSMNDPFIQAELVRQSNYLNTPAARAWANYWHEVNAAADLSEVDDARRFHPDPAHGALTIGGKYASVTVHPRSIIKRNQSLQRWGFPGRGVPIGLQVPVGIRYSHAFNVINCVRRKVRRAVIFARRKNGGGNRKGRRTWKSAIWC